jgi:hypothetical protein
MKKVFVGITHGKEEKTLRHINEKREKNEERLK